MISPGPPNLRDVGAPATSPVLPGRLFRSSLPRDGDGRRLVDDLGVGAVLDLRAAEEAVADGRARFGPATCYADVPLRELERSTMDDGDDPVGQVYVAHLDRDPNLPIALDVLATFLSRVPTLVHCAAGKDRTGMVTALTLGLAGAPRHVIVADHLASAAAMPAVLRTLRALPRHRRNQDTVPAVLYECRESSIRMLLDAVDERYGSFRGWARARGLSPATERTLREALIGT